MCAAPLNMADVFLLGSVGMLITVLMIEACAYLYRCQPIPETLHQRISNSQLSLDNLTNPANAVRAAQLLYGRLWCMVMKPAYSANPILWNAAQAIRMKRITIFLQDIGYVEWLTSE